MLLRLICFARKVFMHHHRIIVAAVAVAALTVGCHSTGSTSAPTPAPSASTVSASPAPSPTPTAGAISATDAENIYRTLHTNVFELEKKGGLVPGEPAPATLSNYATGQALKNYMTFMHQISGLGLTWKSGASKITVVREKKGDTTYPEAAIALESCEDGSSIRSVDRHGQADHGRLTHVDSWYARDKAGTVKMIARNGVEVSSCDVK